MVHLRIVTPPDRTDQVLHVLERSPAVCNIVQLAATAIQPYGDVVLADVAREETSVIVADLKDLDIHRRGSISLVPIDTQLSAFSVRAEQLARGAEGDAVVWEEVEARTEDIAELNWAFVVFMALAAVLAAVGIFLNSAILIVGAMVVGPEFGPIAGVCVALVQRRPRLAAASAKALVIGFPVAIVVAWIASLAFRWTGLTPGTFTEADHDLAVTISNPDAFAFIVAFCAGAAGVLSLTTAKSGALIGVLISVTTIPAAANIGVAAAYADWASFRGSVAQLVINLGGILLAGTLTLAAQRWLFGRRRARHASSDARRFAPIAEARSRAERERV